MNGEVKQKILEQLGEIESETSIALRRLRALIRTGEEPVPDVGMNELREVVPSFGVDGTTAGRGFELVRFTDEYGYPCSIQESSRAVCENEDGTVDDPLGWIWLGIDDANPQIMKSKAQEHGLPLPPGEVSGWMPYPISEDVLLTTRMHLNETQVRGLVARLTRWLETGSLCTREEDGDG